MATVYLGTDVKLGRQVAIKLLAPATRAYLGSDRFQREVLLAAQLSHPHIVPLFERSEEHTSELQSQFHIVCRLLLEKKKHLPRRHCRYQALTPYFPFFEKGH